MRDPDKIQDIEKTVGNNKKVIILSNPPANPVDGRFSFKRDLKTYLEELLTFLQSVSPFQDQIVLNFGYEMDGPWTIYGPLVNSPDEFIKAYKELYSIVKDKYPKITMLWCPNVKYRIEQYFPGNDYIDWTGLNGYNKHRDFPHPSCYNPDTAFNDLFANDVAVLQKLTSKPIFLVETNSTRDGNFRVEWFNTAIETSSRWDQVIGVGGFFWNKATLFYLDPNETNWSVSNDLET